MPRMRYNNQVLYKRSRNIIVFFMLIRLVRNTRLLIRTIMFIFNKLIPIIAIPFIDNISVKRPYINYNKEEIL
ncbi:hypothetical protein LOCC1_G008505 [Lachnellula occidentalis]|uniref:Uncharacterized protein n=1 Tax=Lachnellula occidentalis TaxID=215460 RepID=A0A8H8RFT1_9HELO|nr:hypothetical protein LOCC1_G008505 [Lachnellula occidentalis]